MTELVLRLLGLAGALVLAAWLYWLTAKVLTILTYAEQLLGTSAQLLAVVPSRSAPRTDGAAEQPHPWYTRLRALTGAFRVAPPEGTVPDATDDQLGRWADDGGTPDPPEKPDPPATEPMRLDIAAGIRLHRPTPAPLPADDSWRSRFTFVDGGRRAAALPRTGTGGDT